MLSKYIIAMEDEDRYAQAVDETDSKAMAFTIRDMYMDSPENCDGHPDGDYLYVYEVYEKIT